MAEEKKDIVAQEKKELQSEKEHTVQGKRYIPATDIVETEAELLVYMDMPGVDKEKVNVKVEKNVLSIDGEIDSKPYADIKPLYSEYNIGHYTRNFELSNEIDMEHIEAKIEDGVLLLTLPKIPESQPQVIQVN